MADYTWLDGLQKYIGPSEAYAATLIPTENSKTQYAIDRTKDAARMAEKGYDPNFIAETTGVYQGPDFWKHILINPEPYKKTFKDQTVHNLKEVMDVSGIKQYDPSIEDMEVYFNSGRSKDLKADAVYTPKEDALDVLRNRMHPGLLDHELTHRAELFGTKQTPTRMYYITDTQMKNNTPYNKMFTEVNANIAQATADDRTRADVINTLNTIYSKGRPATIADVYNRVR